MKNTHCFLTRLSLLAVLLLAAATLSAADLISQGWRSIQNGKWWTGFRADIATLKDGVITVNAPGEENTFDVASEEVALNQQEPEAIHFTGWLMRHPGEQSKKALVAYDLLLLFTDGTHRWCVLDNIPPEKAGEWIHTDVTFTPEKPLRALRVLGINNNATTPASFRDMAVAPAARAKTSEAEEAGRLENAVAAYSFVREGDKLRLGALVDKASGANFIQADAADGNIWRVSLKDDRAKTPFVVASGKNAQISFRDGKMEGLWETPLPDGGTLEVRATAALQEDSALLWDVAVQVKGSEHYTMLDVIYPIVNGLVAPGASEKACLLIPHETGRLIRDPARNYPGSLNLHYGASGMSMQFLALYGEETAGLYISTKDGDGHFKEMHLAEQFGHPGVFSFEVSSLAYQGEPAYDRPWPVETRLFHGDWFDACQIYRAWALKQKWMASGPMAQRPDFPEPLRRIGLTVNGVRNQYYSPKQIENRNRLGSNGFSVIPDDELFDVVGGTILVDDFAKTIKALKDFYGFPFDVFNHPYLDHFGRATPRYLLLHGYPEAARRIREMGCYTIPWTTMLRMDTTSERWKKENAEPAAIIDETGKPVVQFADGCMKALMCPATPYWQKVIYDTTERMLKSNLTGMYYDEICSVGPQICLNPKHGHTIGGGNYGLNGYRQIMEATHTRLRAQYPEYYSSGEHLGEYMIGVHDINYMFMYFQPDLVTAFQAVYHDYSICLSRLSGKFHDFSEEYAYADKSGRTNVEEAAVCGLRDIAYGVNPGAVRITLPEYSPKAAALARFLGHFWLDNQKYLLFGQMLRPPKVVSGNATVTTGFPFRDSRKYAYPAVNASVWRAPDDTAALIVTNATITEVVPELKFNAADYTDAPYLRLRDRADGSEVYAGPSGEVRFRLPVAARSARALDIVPETEAPAAVRTALPPFVVWSDNGLLEMGAGATADVWFSLENTTDQAATGSVALEVPQGWGIAPATVTEVALAPHAVQRVVFQVTLPREVKGLQTLSYKVHLAGGENVFDLAQSVDFGVRPYVAESAAGKKCHTVPYLDKIPADRLPESVPVIKDLTSRMIGNGKASPAEARMAWNEEGVVMEFTVKDETPNEPIPGEMVWKGDCIQIGLGFPRIENDVADYYLQTELYLAIVEGKPFVSCRNEAYDPYLKVEASRKDGVTFYRLTVPKRLLREVHKGKRYPFSFTVNEHDGKDFAGWQEWTRGICGGKNPGAWGEILLGE